MDGGRKYVERLWRKEVLPLRKGVNRRMVWGYVLLGDVRLDLGVM